MESGISKRCNELSYRLTINVDEFEADRFEKEVKDISESDTWQTFIVASRPDSPPGFHAHVFWRKRKDKPKEMQLQVDFHRWRTEKKALHGRYSQDVYAWIGQFLKIDKANIHIHAEYEFPVSKWRLKTMPLPIRIPFGEKTATVEGMTMSLAGEPAGVHSAWIALDKKKIDVNLFVLRAIEFVNFKIETDLENFDPVMRNIVEENLS